MFLNANHHQERRHAAQRAILDLFTELTGLPIGLWEVRKGRYHEFISSKSWDQFEPHCRLIQTFSDGKQRCMLDERRRAESREGGESVLPCWAGVYNQRIEVHVEGELRAVLLYGEMQIDHDTKRRISHERHVEAVRQLGLSAQERGRVNHALSKIKTVSPADLERYKNAVRAIVESLYEFFADEDRLDRDAQLMAHDIGIQFVAVKARIAMLQNDLTQFSYDELADELDILHQNALAMMTIINTIGNFLQPYRFGPASLVSVVDEAQRTYAEQARAHGIEFETTFHRGNTLLEVSVPHLQQAINNLVQNAIKYSFRGVPPHRRRFVRIVGRPENDVYSLTISNYGVGILPEEIESGDIFESGYKGKLTRDELRTGGGRGLTFVREVVERHHGSIKVTSECQAEGEPGERWLPYLTQVTLNFPITQP